MPLFVRITRSGTIATGGDRITTASFCLAVVIIIGIVASGIRPGDTITPIHITRTDGPIYAYNDLPPDQVIANVQTALQQEGYYQGEVDGLLGPLTRAALADYQRDHGLYTTAAIDEPTLASLGMG